MRKFILATSFCVLASMMCSTLLHIGRSQEKPTCDGSMAEKVKCPVSMPAGYREALECESEKAGEAACYHSLAYAQDNFACTPGEVKTGSNLNTTICLMYGSTVNCTIRRTCLGQLNSRWVNGEEQPYTLCLVDQTFYSYRYPNATYTIPACDQNETIPGD